MSYTSRAEICGSVQSFLTRRLSLRLRSHLPSYGAGLSVCFFGPIKTIRKNCKVCSTSCWHAAAEKRYSPTSNLDFFSSARASGASQAVPVVLAHLECQGAHVFIQVMEF